MTDTWRTLPEGAAAGLSGNVSHADGEKATTRAEGSSEAHGRSEGLVERARMYPQIVAQLSPPVIAGMLDDLADEIMRTRAELAAAATRFVTALDEQQARLEQARQERRDALAKIARVEAVIAPMHEDWCRAKHDPGRECECIHAEIRAAIDGSET